VNTRDSFDFTATVNALARAGGPEDVARIVGADPRKEAIADWLERTLADSPPATPEQRAGVAAVLRGAKRGAA
jgi:hypothetical protein